jgi:hypothetical protein
MNRFKKHQEKIYLDLIKESMYNLSNKKTGSYESYLEIYNQELEVLVHYEYDEMDEEHNIDITRVELAKSHKNIPEKLWLDHIERFKQEVVLNTNIFDKTDEAEKDYYNS